MCWSSTDFLREFCRIVWVGWFSVFVTNRVKIPITLFLLAIFNPMPTNILYFIYENNFFPRTSCFYNFRCLYGRKVEFYGQNHWLCGVGPLFLGRYPPSILLWDLYFDMELNFRAFWFDSKFFSEEKLIFNSWKQDSYKKYYNFEIRFSLICNLKFNCRELIPFYINCQLTLKCINETKHNSTNYYKGWIEVRWVWWQEHISWKLYNGLPFFPKISRLIIKLSIQLLCVFGARSRPFNPWRQGLHWSESWWWQEQYNGLPSLPNIGRLIVNLSSTH